MASCSSADTNTNAKLYWGQQGDLELTITRSASSTVSLEDAQLEFTVGQTYATPIQTVPAPQITLTTNTASQLVATFSVDEGLISAALGTPGTYTLVWQVEIAAVSGAIATLQGQITLENAFAAEGSIVVPDTIDQNTIVTYATIDPRRFDTDGQIPKWNNDTQTFDPGTDEGGVGSGVSSVNGQTGTVTLTTTNINEGTNLYYTDTRVETVLGAAIATDFSAAVQASLGLADSALQSGDAIPQSDITNLTTDLAAKANAAITLTAGTGLDGGGNLTANRSFALNAATLASLALADSALQADDIGVSLQAYDAVHDQLAALTVANGQVIGWIGGALGNISISGGGDMLKSVYDTDDNGIVDAAESVPWSGVTSPPTTLAGYGITDAFDGAYSSLSGIPATFAPAAHNQAWSTITATPTTLAGYGITDAATSAQGTLADSATQPGDNISTLTNDSGYLTAVTLGYTAAPTQGTVTNDAGANAVIPAADVTNAGLLLPAEKASIASALNASAVSAFGLTLIDDADAATARGTLGIIRPKHYRDTDQTKTTLSGTWADIGLEITLTPQSGVALVVNAQINHRITAGVLAVRLLQDGSEIFNPNARNSTAPFLVNQPATQYDVVPMPTYRIDSPGTSPITLKVQARSGGAGTVEINPDAGSGEPGLSAMEVQEVFI